MTVSPNPRPRIWKHLDGQGVTFQCPNCPSNDFQEYWDTPQTSATTLLLHDGKITAHTDYDGVKTHDPKPSYGIECALCCTQIHVDEPNFDTEP